MSYNKLPCKGINMASNVNALAIINKYLGEIYKEHCFVVDLEWLEHMWSRHFKSLFQYQYSLEEFLNEYDPEYEGQVIYLVAKSQNQIIDECYEII
jgi:hypothetical protein